MREPATSAVFPFDLILARETGPHDEEDAEVPPVIRTGVIDEFCDVVYGVGTLDVCRAGGYRPRIEVW
jgi:hypothetical protein